MLAVLILCAFLLLGLAVAMVAAWKIALRTERSGWIDAIWTFSVGAAGTLAALAPIPHGAFAPRQYLVAALVAVWSLRLGVHIALRTNSAGDDPRYAQLRKEWGTSYSQRLFWFVQVQAAAAVPLVLSIMVAAHNPILGLGAGDWIGAVVFGVAIAGEAAADRQLSDFRADPRNKGRVCNAGLWAYSRHPNYFFEWLIWMAYVFIAVDFAGRYPYGWLSLAGPVLMYWLLVHVSGIPLLEAHMLRSRGEAFRSYQERTNAFWPGLSRKQPDVD
jgi:steroid 5-alpha reductase family enzyme